MSSHSVGLLVVVEGEKTVGVLSQSDIVTAVSERRADALDMPVAGIMARDIVACASGEDMESALDLMISNGIRHLLIDDGDGPLGVISLRDIATHASDTVTFYEL